jgi:EmrB/QacA subfamily drug resistance transporter
VSASSHDSNKEELGPKGPESLGPQSSGVDESSTVPWSLLVSKRIAKRVGLSRKWAVLIVVLVGLFTTSSTITILVVSLETISNDINSSVSTLNWAITGPMLAFGVVGPAFGKIGDLYGHKKVYVYGLAISGLFAGATVFAWSAASMVTFRVLSATAGSATGPAAMAYINRLFEPHERVRPLSIWSFTTAGAPVLGVVLGGPLIESVGWRIIFVIQAPLCFIAAFIAWKMLPQTSRIKNVRFDVMGSVTLGLGAVFVLLGINRGNSWGWTSPATLLGIAVGVATIAVFVQVEKRAEEPLMPLHWLGRRNLVMPVVSQSFTNFAYMGGFILIPQLLERGLGFSAAFVGWLIVARPLAFSLAAPTASFVTMRVGERASAVVGSGIVVLAMILFALIDVGSSSWFIAGALAISGIGLGISSPSLTALVANAVDDRDMGVAGALQQLMNQLAAVAGTTVMISVQESLEPSGVVRSFSIAFVVGACVSALGTFAAFYVRSTDRSTIR